MEVTSWAAFSGDMSKKTEVFLGSCLIKSRELVLGKDVEEVECIFRGC